MEFVADNLAITDDHPDQVEVMGDATSELTDGLSFCAIRNCSKYLRSVMFKCITTAPPRRSLDRGVTVSKNEACRWRWTWIFHVRPRLQHRKNSLGDLLSVGRAVSSRAFAKLDVIVANLISGALNPLDVGESPLRFVHRDDDPVGIE